MAKGVLVVAALFGAALALWGLDRLLLAAEARGWIYWRRRRGHSDRFADAAFGLQSLLEPGKRHVVEARREARSKLEERGSGAPPGEMDPGDEPSRSAGSE